MKKILGVLMILVLLVSCSRDSSDNVELTSDYIEVAGVKHQIDKFEISNESDFWIGSKKDGTYVSFGFTWYKVPIGEKVYFAEVDNDDGFGGFQYFDLVDGGRKCNLTDGSSDSYFYITKNGDNYNVEVYIGSSKYKTIVHYYGTMK